MKKYILLSLIIIFSVSLFAVQKTKFEAYPKMYEYNPKSILVLPPLNYTTAVDAKEYLSCTITKPLANTGYYVLPIDVTDELLKSEGLYDTELITDDILIQFKELLGADAVLIPELIYWDKSYYVIGGNVKVGVRYTLKSTATAEVLWIYEGMMTVDTSNNQASAPGMAGLFLSLAVTAAQTAAQDYFPIAEKVNQKIFKTIPFGEYHNKHNIDQQKFIHYPKKNAEFMELASQNNRPIENKEINRDIKKNTNNRVDGLDYIILKDGRTLSGEILSFNKKTVELKRDKTLITIDRDLVIRVEDHNETDVTKLCNEKDYPKINFNTFTDFEKIN